jgi:serine O-acetyltransferase
MNRPQLLVRLQRFGHKLSRHRTLRPLARIIDLIIRLVWSAHIPPEVRIAATARFGHNGLAVIVHPLCEIGADCLIGPQVVLGGRAPIIGAPIVEDSVLVHAGAKIFGKIRIGAGSVIGANAVVMEDVPPRSLVVGVPGKVRKTDINVNDYR